MGDFFPDATLRNEKTLRFCYHTRRLRCKCFWTFPEKFAPDHVGWALEAPGTHPSGTGRPTCSRFTSIPSRTPSRQGGGASHSRIMPRTCDHPRFFGHVATACCCADCADRSTAIIRGPSDTLQPATMAPRTQNRSRAEGAIFGKGNGGRECARDLAPRLHRDARSKAASPVTPGPARGRVSAKRRAGRRRRSRSL